MKRKGNGNGNGRHGEVKWGQWGGKSEEGMQGTGFTYMRWEGMQGGNSLFWVRTFPFREIRLQARAGLVHTHGPTCPS